MGIKIQEIKLVETTGGIEKNVVRYHNIYFSVVDKKSRQINFILSDGSKCFEKKSSEKERKFVNWREGVAVLYMACNKEK